MVRFYILAEGRVQGVGFRYHAVMVANKYNITGYAKNLSNGSVEIEAQGEEASISKFLEEVKRGNGFAKVTSLYKENIPLKNSEKSFKPLY